MFYFLVGIIVVILGASYFLVGRSFFIRRKHILLTSIFLIVLAWLVYQASLVYFAWLIDLQGRYLLPPYREIAYFLQYVGFRIFVPYIVSFLAGVIFFFAAKFLNRKYDERFFEPEEPYFLALSLFLLGHPGWLVYLVAVFVAYFFFHIIHALIANRTDRLPFYHFWLPVALFVILLNEFWFSHTGFWSLMGFGKLM